ncbi:MAG: serine/threonine protein kinase [Granulosicoccus sp.]
MEVSDRQTILSPGDMLGCYRIDSFLGQGGFGVTYVARDTMLDIQVAIKEYLPERIVHRVSTHAVQPRSNSDADVFNRGLANFLKEARTLARFNHPNIVRVKSVFELNGTAYMVMEYERGHDLKVLFSRREHICETVLKAIIGPVIDGLEEVHCHGFIHRDIKPANILVRENGSPVLLDFGSARLAVGNNTDLLTAMVTVGFAPLEQYSGLDDQQGPWSDVYALGAVLYYAVTGNAPPDSTLRGAAVLNEKTDPYLPLMQLSPEGYSHAFCHAVDWALSFKVSARPQSLNQWRSQLFDDEPQAPLMEKNDAAFAGLTAPQPITQPVGSPARSAGDDTANDRTVLNPRTPDNLTGSDAFTDSRQAEIVEFDSSTEVDFEGLHDDRRRLDNRPARGFFQHKDMAGQNYVLPGVAAAVAIGVIGIAIFGPWKSPPDADQPEASTMATAAPVDATQASDEDSTPPLATLQTIEDPLSQATMAAPTEFVSQTPPVEDEQSVALMLQAIKEQEQAAEADRQAAARAARLEADREVQRVEARRQAELLREREAEIAAERKRQAEATREANRQADIGRQQARQSAAALALERSTTRPVISSADMSDVLSRFNALSEAIEQRDAVALRDITMPSDRKTAYFDYVFRTFDKVQVDVSEISASRQDQTIRAKLSVMRLIRGNGDIAIPPDEFRNIPIYSVKETTWSPIHW